MASWLSRWLQGSEQHQIHGIPVELRNTRADIADGDVLERLKEALDLLDRHAARRLAHLRRDVRAIRIERFPTRGAFLPAEGVVLAELTFLARRDITAAPVASSILHEGVHARVHAFRQAVLGGRSPWADPAKEERLCRRQELEFGMSLPAELGGPVIERALASLALADNDVAPAIDWSLARARQDAIDRADGQ